LALDPVLKEKGYVKNEDIRKTLRVSVKQATRIAALLVSTGWLHPEGRLKARRYIQAKKLLDTFRSLLDTLKLDVSNIRMSNKHGRWRCTNRLERRSFK
jgi:hypothetical protein